MDAVGNEILLGDTVVTSYMGSQIRAYVVVGFTPMKVRLGRPGTGGGNQYTVLKYANEVAVVQPPAGYSF